MRKLTYKVVKRCTDIAVAGLGLLLLSPLLLLIALLVVVFLGQPILFRQQRPGLHGRPFLLCKFRTMSNCRASDGKLLSDAARLTRLGRLLRSTSLDELPQLWNVLCGKMSLVGPRPLLMEYLPRYSAEQARRHDVRPGITGWAQVNGRNAISWPEKFKLDVWYVEHAGIGVDLWIFWMTFSRVVHRSGISNATHATMPMFTGNDAESHG